MGTEEYGKGRPGEGLDLWVKVRDDGKVVIQLSARVREIVLTREETIDLFHTLREILSIFKKTGKELVKR